MFEAQYQDKKQVEVMSRLETGSPQSRYNFTRQQGGGQLDNSSHSPDHGFGRQNISHHRQYDQGRADPAPKPLAQFGHCPKVSSIE